MSKRCTWVYEEGCSSEALYGPDGRLLAGAECEQLEFTEIYKEHGCDELELVQADTESDKLYRCMSVGDYGGGPVECDLIWPDELDESWLLRGERQLGIEDDGPPCAWCERREAMLGDTLCIECWGAKQAGFTAEEARAMLEGELRRGG